MKSIQITAIILWVFIFVVAAFVLGQFLVSKDVFDITTIITGKGDETDLKEDVIEDEFANEIVINKVGQETVRVGLNIVEGYFSDYYKEYINYIMANLDKYLSQESIVMTNTLASDYVFYAVSRNIDKDKYESLQEKNLEQISEAELNSFIDKMFGMQIDEAYKKDGKNGYDKLSKKYNIEKNTGHEEYKQELQEIKNITSNEICLTYKCAGLDQKEQQIIKLICTYKGGRYIITEVQI